MLDLNRFVPQGKVLAVYIAGKTEVFMPGDEITQEQLDGGILLDYSASCQAVTVPEGYTFVLVNKHGVGTYPHNSLVDLDQLRKGRMVLDHERFAYTSSLVFGDDSPYGRG